MEVSNKISLQTRLRDSNFKETYILEIINQSQPIVEVYGTKICPYCIQAKRLVAQKDWELKEYKVDEMTELREEMEQRAGKPVRTVPQIFVNGEYVGGYTDFVNFLDVTELV